MKQIKNNSKFNWDEFFSAKGTKWRDKDYRFLSNNFSLDQLKGELIDVGCGLGDGLRFLKTTCPQVTQFYGMDFSREAVKINRDNPLMKDIIFYNHDIQKPITKQFDNVICLQVLEHLQDPTLAFSHLIRMTKKVLIVVSPYQNARPDEDHKWSFDLNDFKEETDKCFVGDNDLNIYWMRYQS